MSEFPEVVDMSPEAIARRIRRVSELHALSKSLQKAIDLGPADARGLGRQAARHSTDRTAE